MVPTCASRSHGWSLEKAFTHARFSTNPCDGRAAFAAAMDQIDTADMAELDAREGGLESLTRRVDWEALHMQPRCRARGQEVLDQMATVKGRALSVQDSTPTEQSTKRARPAPWEQPWIPRGFLRTRVTASRRLREMREVNITHMPHLYTRELLPDALVGVQLQGIRRQALQVQPRRRAVGQELLDGVAAVDRRAIPDASHLARHLPQQVFENGHDVDGIHRLVLARDIQVALRGDRADGGEVIRGPPLPHHGGLPERRIRAHHAGQGINARFIDVDDRLIGPIASHGEAEHVVRG